MKKVVIIGGGFAGALAARKLEDFFSVTLVDNKDYFEFTPGILRTLIDPDHAPKIQCQHQRYLKKAEVLVAEAASVSDTFVTTSKGKKEFDYLLICSGSRYATPIKEKNLVMATRASLLQEQSQKLRKAASVLIIGGGLVGVELAAEICVAYPQKKITLVHALSTIIPRMSDRAREFTHRFLQQGGVEMILGERVIKAHTHYYSTDKGRRISAEVAFLCTGITPNFEFLPQGMLNECNQIKVNSFLQVQGYRNIFSAGDITCMQEEKTAQNAEKQALVVVENIKRLEKGKPLKSYSSKARIMVTSLGPWKGIITYKQRAYSGIFPGILKRLIEWRSMFFYRYI